METVPATAGPVQLLPRSPSSGPALPNVVPYLPRAVETAPSPRLQALQQAQVTGERSRTQGVKEGGAGGPGASFRLPPQTQARPQPWGPGSPHGRWRPASGRQVRSWPGPAAHRSGHRQSPARGPWR